MARLVMPGEYQSPISQKNPQKHIQSAWKVQKNDGTNLEINPEVCATYDKHLDGCQSSLMNLNQSGLGLVVYD